MKRRTARAVARDHRRVARSLPERPLARIDVAELARQHAGPVAEAFMRALEAGR